MPSFLTPAFLLLAVPALALSSLSTLAAGLAWLFICLAGFSAWWGRNTDNDPPVHSPALQAAQTWLLACAATFVLMAIPTAYWGGPWPERHPQWRLLLGAAGLWLLLRYRPPTARNIYALTSAAAVSSLLAESFFQLLKRERIRRQIYPTRQEARADVFNYIEMFYNPKRRHNTSDSVSPVEFEKRQSQQLGSVY